MSGLGAEQVAQASTSYDAVRILPAGVFWVEGGAHGRDALRCWTAKSGCQDLIPEGFSVGSYVHEYGGGAWAAADGAVWFCNAADQGLYRVEAGEVRPASAGARRADDVRYGDLHIDPNGRWLWAVRERHAPWQVINELVRIPAMPGAPSVAVASGRDFYSSPRPSPDGRYLAWTCWDAPRMPWDGTCLFVGRVGSGGEVSEPVLVAGGSEESVFQPEWSSDGVLHFVSDRSGWWNLYAWRAGDAVPVLACEAEMGVAEWELGYSTYSFLGAGRIAVIVQRGGCQSLDVIEQGRTWTVDLPYTSIKPYLSAHDGQVALIGSSPAEPPSVAVVDIGRGDVRTVAATGSAAGVAPVVAEPFSFAARDGMVVHGLFYPPLDVGVVRPLVVKAHPGPTANVPMRLDWHTQYLVSNGFAVAEIDYRGSTGYGRAFRNSLRGAWGERDALDCADGAMHLIRLGQAHPGQTMIWGASAGGYTALRALILTDMFAGGIARSPMIDPRIWRENAPKFQAHHPDLLIGPWPDAAALYRKRSVLQGAAGIRCPVLLVHGDADRVTPLSESLALAGVLGDRARLVVLPGEGHTWHSPEVVARVLSAELEFLRAITL